MPWREELDSGFSDNQRDDGVNIRDDIADELFDHLECSYRDALLREGDESVARRSVLDRFGDPAVVARQLWWESMKGHIMKNHIRTGMITIALTLSCIAVGLVVNKPDLKTIEDRWNRLSAQLNAQNVTTQKLKAQLESSQQKAKEAAYGGYEGENGSGYEGMGMGSSMGGAMGMGAGMGMGEYGGMESGGSEGLSTLGGEGAEMEGGYGYDAGEGMAMGPGMAGGGGSMGMGGGASMGMGSGLGMSGGMMGGMGGAEDYAGGMGDGGNYEGAMGMMFGTENAEKARATRLEKLLRELFPESEITVVYLNQSILLRGAAVSPKEATEITEVAGEFFKKVLNHLDSDSPEDSSTEELGI